MHHRTDWHEFEHEGLRCIVAYDETPESPDGWGDKELFLGEVTHSGKSYFGRDGWDIGTARAYVPFAELWDEVYSEMYDSPEEALEYEDHSGPGAEYVGFAVFPVSACETRGGWDVSLCSHNEAQGYVFVRVPWKTNDPVERLAYPDFNPMRLAEGLLEEWNMYLSGDVHWARVEDSSGEILESCSNLYGSDAATGWCEETAAVLADKTRTVAVLVTKGAEPDFDSTVVDIDVPYAVGDVDVPEWALEDGPLKADPSVVQVNLYVPRT